MGALEAKAIRQQLKILFKGYRHITKKIRKGLHSLGFILENGKTHYKIYYGNEHSHAVTISKTASDWRTGLNICAQLVNILPKTSA